MSYVIAAPEMIASAASDVANIGSTLNAANAAAVTPTVAVLPAAADEVSASIANLLSAHAANYQALAGRAAAFHEQFVQALTGDAGSYVGAEAANVAAFTANPVASAAAAQLAPLQSVHALASQLAGALGLSPVTMPIPGENLMRQTTNFGSLSKTYTVDPDDRYVAVRFSTPLFTGMVTSGFEETQGVGVPGQTILMFQSPVSPVLNASLALPITDPLVPVFTALLPLGF
jgi:hypothetical protein